MVSRQPLKLLVAVVLSGMFSTSSLAWWGPGGYPNPWSGSYPTPYRSIGAPAGWGYPENSYWGGYPRGYSQWRPVNYHGPWGSMNGGVSPNGEFYMNITVSGSIALLINELQMRALMNSSW